MCQHIRDTLAQSRLSLALGSSSEGFGLPGGKWQAGRRESQGGSGGQRQGVERKEGNGSQGTDWASCLEPAFTSSSCPFRTSPTLFNRKYVCVRVFVLCIYCNLQVRLTVQLKKQLALKM